VRILVTNDDGIHAPGIRALAEAVSGFGTVKVVAPDRERSACGHAMTMRDPLRVEPHKWGSIEAFAVNGLPVDCVNVGLTTAFPDGCDVVLSGINKGPNLGYDVTYSGTVGGAMEGAINGIRAIAISVAAFVTCEPSHFETAAAWMTANFKTLVDLHLPPETYLNVNVPAVGPEELAGHAFVAAGGRIYEDRVELRDDPWGKPYYWQGGVAILDGHQPDTDLDVIQRNMVSITPLRVNWTDHETLARLKM
jgi:5'-nucleotidase